jgi:hypothetical protein
MVSTGKDTVFVVHNLQHSFARRIVVGYTFPLHHLPWFYSHHREQFGQHGTKAFFLLGRYLRTCVTLDAAATLAVVEVTAELLLQYLQTDYGVLYKQHI